MTTWSMSEPGSFAASTAGKWDCKDASRQLDAGDFPVGGFAGVAAAFPALPERAEHEPQADDRPRTPDPPPQARLILRCREEQVEHDEHDGRDRHGADDPVPLAYC